MIALTSPSRRSVMGAVSSGTTAPVRWVYLGSSVRKAQQVTRWLGPKAQRIIISEILQRAAWEIWTSYIEYIGGLGKAHASNAWWFSSLSEKNPGVSQAFLHICYLKVAADLCRQPREMGLFLVITEDAGVQYAIATHLRESGVGFFDAAKPSCYRVAQAARGWAEMLARKAWGIGRHVYRMIVAKALGFPEGVLNERVNIATRPWILLHNWVDARSFDAHGRYNDIFFGSLRDELQKRGLSVAVVAAVLYKASYGRLLLQLKRSGIPALVPHAALTAGDLLGWARSLLRKPPERRAWPRFSGFDVSEILHEDERRDWMHARVDDVRLIAPVIRNWRQRLALGAFIYTYEGHTWERGYCRAVREHFPKARLIGYQHSTLSPMYLSHFISKAEWGKVPFPDRVVTNGAYPYDLLRQNGVPEQVLSCGGAVRYDVLGSGVSARVAGGSDRPAVRILAAFSIFLTQAAELLLAVREAFSDSSEFQVLLKFHPSLSVSRVAAEAGLPLRSLPAYMQVVDRQLSQLLQEADVLVYTDTTAAIEALARGIPVVHLMSGQGIDMDRLGPFDGARVSAGTAEGLRAAVESVLKAGAEERTTRLRCWQEVVALLWPPPDEKTIDLFMPENVR